LVISDYFDRVLNWLNPEVFISCNDTEGQIASFDFKYRDLLILKAVKSD